MNPQTTKEGLELERRTMGEYDFNREYNAQFIDDQFTYFPSTLVLGCVDDYTLNPEPQPGQKLKGNFYVGVDFGKHADHSAIAITQEQPDHTLKLVYLRQFPLETPYTTVIATLQLLNSIYMFLRGYVDQTGVGEAPYEEVRKFAPCIRGITFTAKTKQEILGNLLLTMERKDVTIPRGPKQLLTQLTQQRCEPTQQGTYSFTHPSGTHDDLMWAFALSVYAYPGPTEWMNTVIGIRRPE